MGTDEFLRTFHCFFHFSRSLQSECYFPTVSTLAEIEAAADTLPLAQKKELFQFLASRVNGAQEPGGVTDLGSFAGTLRLAEDPLAWQRRIRGEWQ